jgi:threonine dehydratase
MPSFDPVDSPDHTTVFPYHDLEPPTTRDILQARDLHDRYIPRTPVVRSESLSAELSADVYLKREDVLPTRSFKIRGFYNLATGLAPEFREKGFITASMGNHGQGLAMAAREVDIPARIVVPRTLENPTKITNMERLGATVVKHGQDVDEAREHAEDQAAEEGYRFVHGGNEPDLIAGRAVAGLEIMEDLPEVDTLISPVGGGSSAAAYSLTAGKLLGADVIGVQATGADAVYQAWTTGELGFQNEAQTVAEGLKTRTPFWLPLQILRDHLTDMVRVTDEAIEAAISHLLTEESVLAEGAGAASTAAARKLDDQLAGQTVVVVVSGGNLSSHRLSEILLAQKDAS